MKASKASGHSSSRSRKSSTKSPPPTPPDECFVPDQYGHHQYQPQYEAPPPHALSSAKPVGGVLMDQGRDVLKHLEAKESRMLQLTALLETMKEETAGTTQAMGRTLDENAHLHHLNQQLTADVVRATNAAEAQKADHEKQLQEIIQVFTDERRDLQKKFEVYIESRQAEFDAARVAHDAEVAKFSQSTIDLQERNRQLQHERDASHDELGATKDHLTVAVRELEMEKEQHGAALAAVTASMNEANAEKEELGKLLADTFRDLERCRAALVEANNNVARLTASLAQNDLSWTHTLTSLEKQIVDSNAQQQLVQDSLRAAESALQVERSQKEELNAAMRAELQRYTDELHEMQTNHANALALVISDRDECQVQLKHAQDQHNATEKQVLVVTRQFEEALHDAAHKLHAQSADSAKYRATAERNLAELNAQCVAMAQDLDACKLAKQASDAVIEALRASCGKLAALIGIDTSSTMEEAVVKVESVVAASIVRDRLVETLETKTKELELEHAAVAEQLAQAQQNLSNATNELDAVKQDCAALVVEIQALTTTHDNELGALNASSQRAADEAEALKQSLAMTTMQLQRSVDKQRDRIDQLEHEKRDLLQEAEALNKSLEMAYQAKASLQIEIDTIKTRFATLQSDHNDLQDAHGQLNAAATADLAELKAKLADAESVYQRERTAWDEQSRSLVAAIATLEGQATSLNDVALQAREDADTARHEAKDLADTLERTRIELVDVQDLCAEWKEKAEALAATSTSVESTLKADLTASSNQCLALAADKRRLESSVAALDALHGQLNADMHALRQEKQCISKHLEERDDELLRVQGDLGQVRAELERLARSKQTLQAELSRAADDLNDSLRQLEVLRREFRAQEKAHAAAVEGLQKDLDALRHEQSETLAMNDELQAKISTIQSAANATINDLVAEVTHAEELVKVEQASRAKDDELLRSQCRYVEEDLKRKEIEWKDATNMLKRELAVRRDSFVTLETKYQKQKELLEAKKAEVDKLTRENEQRQLKVAEIERKLAPLANIKETMTTRLSEMKLICDAKLKESHDLEEKLRDEIVRLQKDKRDLESTHLRAKDEMDSSSAGRFALVHQQLTSENKVLKSTLDRTKQELQHATENVAALAQRLDGQQKASQATIADLTSRMQTFDQQYQAALQGMSRELAVEKERTSELLAQKSQLLKQLRRLQRPPSSDESQQHQLATSRNLSTLQPEVATDQGGGQVPKTHRSTGDLTSYEDLANIPVALLRAQIGLDMFSFEEQHGSNQQPDGGSAAVPSLNLDSLNTSRSTPYSHDMSSRLESGIAVEEGSGAKSKMAASKAKDVTSLKRLKKKMATKQSDDHASFKLKATESLPKLV